MNFGEYFKISIFSIIEILVLCVFLFVLYKVLGISQTFQTIKDYIIGNLVCYVICRVNIINYKLDKLRKRMQQ